MLLALVRRSMLLSGEQTVPLIQAHLLLVVVFCWCLAQEEQCAAAKHQLGQK